MVSGGMTCIKYLLFAFNLVFVIFGILLIYSGIQAVVNIGPYRQLIEDVPNNTAITLIIIGFAIFLIAFFGCCGAIKENYCMLITFSSIILTLLLIELIGAGLLFAFKNKLKVVAKDGITKAIVKYKNNSTDDTLNKVLDDIQSHLKCCGANDMNDWNLNEEYNNTNEYPYSCCDRKNPENPNAHCVILKEVYPKGCVDALDFEIRGSIALLGGIAIAIAIIQLLGIVFACGLSRSIKKEYEVV